MFYQPLPFYEKKIFQNNNRYWVGDEDYSYILQQNRWEFVPFVVEKTNSDPIASNDEVYLMSKSTGKGLLLNSILTWNYAGNFAKLTTFSINATTSLPVTDFSSSTFENFVANNGDYYYIWLTGTNIKCPFSEIFRFSKHDLYTVEPTSCNQIRIDALLTKDFYGIPVQDWGGVSFRSWYETEVVRPQFEYVEEVEEDNVGDGTVIYKKLIERRSFQVVVDEQTAGYLNTLPLYQAVSIFDQLGRIYHNPKKWNITTDWIDESSAFATVTVEFWVDSQAISGC